VLTTIAGLLIGPVVGFCVTYCLYYVFYRDNCMWRLIAVSMSLFLGAPIGLALCGVIGFVLGRRQDAKAARRLYQENDPRPRQAGTGSPTGDLGDSDAGER
jgi:hypothetical protein